MTYYFQLKTKNIKDKIIVIKLIILNIKNVTVKLFKLTNIKEVHKGGNP